MSYTYRQRGEREKALKRRCTGGSSIPISGESEGVRSRATREDEFHFLILSKGKGGQSRKGGEEGSLHLDYLFSKLGIKSFIH